MKKGRIGVARSAAQRELQQGVDLLEAGHVAAAVEAFRRLVQARPQLGEAHYQLGLALRRLGDAVGSRQSFEQAVAHRPDFPNGWYRLGNAWHDDGRFDEALRHYDRAIALAPDVPLFHFNRSVVLRKLNRLEEAVQSGARALQLNPAHAEGQCNLGNLLLRLNRHAEAGQAFDRALGLKPDLVEALVGKGRSLLARHQPAPALALLEEAIALAPGRGEAHYGRGACLREFGRNEEALEALRHSQTLDYDNPEVDLHIGMALCELGRYAEAEAHYLQVIARIPDYFRHGPTLHLALLRLCLGRYAEGWPDYEARLLDPPLVARHVQRGLQGRTPWLGERSLQGRTLLVLDEQGLGDTLQFWRFLPQLEALAGKVLVETPAAVRPLVEGQGGAATLVPEGPPYPDFDEYCHLLSLPLALGITLENLPAATPYLRVPAAQRERWRARLGPRDGRLRVGLAWSGNPAHVNDHRRSLPLAALAPLLALDCEFHVVQKDLRAGDQALLDQHPAVRQHGVALTDVAETAALVDELDLVISVDTALAHLAGALGRPVWALVTAWPDFRWLLERSDSPWYPSARIFRQPAPLAWDSVIAEVCAALAAHALAAPAP